MNQLLSAGAIAVLGLTVVESAPAQTPTESSRARTATVIDARQTQGFSVVLVVGDLSGGTTQDNVPPAARKALSDMKDFLPYKSYRLLDVHWTLCCGGRETTPAVSRLRGPDGRDYELTLAASVEPRSRLGVRFALRDPSGTESAGGELIRELQVERQRLELEYEKLRQRVQSSFEVGMAKPPDEDPEVLRARQRVAEAGIKLAQAKQREAQQRDAQKRSEGRGASFKARATGPMIDTSFTMDVGETVVVGTSRIAGGDKALIALLTAVPRSAPAPK
jgi:hypothetical protein